jgi:uncharacterized protein (TIGR03437 family)
MPGLCAAQPSVIFGNFTYTLDFPTMVQATGSAAAQFTPAVDYLATVVKVPAGYYGEVGYQGGAPSGPSAFSAAIFAAIFSDAAGVPGAPVSQTVAVTAPALAGGIVTVSFAPMALHAGTPYWLVLTPAGASTGISWEVGGVPTAPFALTQSAAGTEGWHLSSGGIGPIGSNVQFEVDGTSPAVNSPAPAITSLSPASAAAGVAFTLTIDGFGFVQCAATPCLGVALFPPIEDLAFIPGQANAAGTQLTATIPAALIPFAGTATVTVQSAWGVSRVSGATSNSVPFTIAPAGPAVNAGGVLNSGSYTTQGVAPGSIVSIFGTNLAASTAAASAIPLPTALSDVTSVMLNNIPAGLYFVSQNQINAQVPFDVLLPGQDSGTVNIVVTRSSGTSALENVTVVPASPGIFTTTANGLGQAFAYDNSTGALAAPAGAPIGPFTTAPISVSSKHALIVACTGLGSVTPSIDNYVAASDGTLRNTLLQPTVFIGGVQAQFVYSVISPQFVSEYQIGVVPDPATPTGDAVSLQIQIGGATTTDQVTIAVAP